MTSFLNRVTKGPNKPFQRLANSALLALSAAFCVAEAQAAGYAGTQFEIEMVVFSREEGMQTSRETWPATPKLTYDKHWVDFNSPSANDPLLPALEPAANQLNNKVASLNRNPRYTVLFHKTWRQVLQTERNAPAVLINGGTPSDEHHQLEGSVTISVSRYLHLSTDLWFSEWAQQPQLQPTDWNMEPQQADSTSAQGIAVPTQPRAPLLPVAESEPLGLGASAEPATSSFNSSNSFSTSADFASFGDEENTRALPEEKIAERVAVLQEERRLRSGELHYIDHPKLGVLIEVRTVEQTEDEEQDPLLQSE
ncbi:CsiV family protein [Microbulbifer agarilyticus]|uniref:CsiV family protein n=1 Tax=Microbulbifer agarilyticus TaxID=260552 RepID=UPI001CD7D603|nr:CsiV family protein [Microbulbifer agarilyticus]MCA0893673.1 peptidoglycan binding protein CsiV [Microbulbifer agarilyticus]